MRKILSCFSLLVLITVFLTGCFSSQNAMQSWIGATKAQLYQRFGPPDRITDDGQGGEILIYEKTEEGGGSTPQTTNSTVQSNVPNNSSLNTSGLDANMFVPQAHYKHTYIKMFYSNKQGVIYYCRFETR